MNRKLGLCLKKDSFFCVLLNLKIDNMLFIAIAFELNKINLCVWSRRLNIKFRRNDQVVCDNDESLTPHALHEGCTNFCTPHSYYNVMNLFFYERVCATTTSYFVTVPSPGITIAGFSHLWEVEATQKLWRRTGIWIPGRIYIYSI